ncbi:hypothetical protein BDQ12DRAFT_691598 [Crucibulum laeve]|uniref:Uncharacterized protein n=1 Tax=Crucibulum laeve TaxID=68775 RepID=A0A5C3LJN4_9AGAR|nr:hypothetical protein BDQ12DRAFT_691598 [Crucibulum laeve]
MQSFLSPLASVPSQSTHQVPAMNTADNLRVTLGELLSRAYSHPCTTAAAMFLQLIQPMQRFQVALDALLPLLDVNTSAELAQRILVSFILYSLYAPHPIAINPFKSALFVTFVKERERAVSIAKDGGISPNEQLVWVLWKILKGDGNDIGPYTPITLAKTPLPPKLRASNLVLDNELYNSISDLDDSTYSYFQQLNSRTSASSDANETHKSITNGSDSFSRSPISIEEDRYNERLIHAAKLLLSAREKVLSLKDQQMVFPMLPDITASRIITSIDLAPIISLNPGMGDSICAALLQTASKDNDNLARFLDTLPFLLPTHQILDLYLRLLQDQTRINIPGFSTIADLVRMEVLGRFVHEAINWLDHAERDEIEGLVSDDRFAKGVFHLCRFYKKLIEVSIVDPTSDADSAEMAHFALRNSRFTDANHLYRMLARDRF